MAISSDELQGLLRAAFPSAEIKLIDLVGDQDHWSLEIAALEFAGKSRVQQHKMVNSALSTVLKAQLHALQISTKTLP